jgi:tight adherence protein B
MENPMGQEMRLVAQEMRVGVSMEDALHHLAERMPGEDLDLLITSILISREVGGNLSEVFDNIANTIRDRLRLQGKIRALTAQGKLQGIVVALLPVGIGLALNALNPAFFRPMYTTTMGASFLGAIVVLELIGAWFIRKIVTIKI